MRRRNARFDAGVAPFVLSRLTLTLALLAACRSPASALVTPPAPVAAAIDAGARRPAPDLEAAELAKRPLATSSAVQFRGHWAVLGQNLIDTTTRQLARTLPFGELRFSDDGQRFALYDGRTVYFGALDVADQDYAVGCALDGMWTLSLARTGASALLSNLAGEIVLVDVRARTHAVVAGPLERGVQDYQERRHFASADGRRVTWIDGETARVRDLDAGTTREEREGGKRGRASELAGDVLVTLFDDTLVVRMLSTDAVVLRVKPARAFVLSDDAKTLVWEDASERLQTVVLFDVEHAREVRRVPLEDAPQAKARRFVGACGGGAFSLMSPSATLRGVELSVERGCSLIDDVTVDLDPGGYVSITSFTPGDQFREEQESIAACHRAHVSCGEEGTVVWLGDRKRAALRGGGSVTIAEVATGARRATLAEAGSLRPDDALAASPDGKLLAAIDGQRVARLWDSETGKVLWSGPEQAE